MPRMIRVLFLLLPSIAMAAAPQTTLIRHDGTSQAIGLPFDGDRVRVIVEFTSPPLVRTPGAIRTQAAALTTMERFRRDLATTISTQSAKRSVATIDREYVNAFSGAAVTLDPSSIARVRSFPYVSRVTFDAPVYATVEPGIAAVRAPEVWTNLGTRGAGITVAIIDTGIDYAHPALGGGFGPTFKVIGGHNFVNNDDDPMDDNNHGTHVAGTIAANSDELLGVAPEAKLIAYKVLREDGSGFMSDIIAAIERCVDPNGDGDFADHVDAVNVSLGGAGNPDDPQSRAVDAAVDAGVVFVIAAGNGVLFQSIGSPGNAARAITVGAVDASGARAYFSSRGPSAMQYTIKPDVVAPGVDVVSARLGGGTIAFSGTSMASPHVTGIVALLLALHPDWTPQQIKSAIVTTSHAVTDGLPEEIAVMAVGAGRVDALRAASASNDVTPSSLSFGKTDGTDATWTRHLTMSVKNRGDVPRTYTTSASGTGYGIALVLTPPTLTLAPGESQDIEATLTVDNALVPFPDDTSFSYGGWLAIGTGADSLRVPWAFAKGHSINVTYRDQHSVTVFLTQDPDRLWFMPPTGQGAFGMLVMPGTYDLAVISFPPGHVQPPALQFFEQQQIDSDRLYDLGYDSAPYSVDFSPLDESGTPLGNAPGGCKHLRTVQLPGTLDWLQFVSESEYSGLHMSAMSESVSIFANDLCIDDPPSRIHSVNYEPLHGLEQSTLRVAGGDAFIRQNVELRFPLPADGERLLLIGAASHINGQYGGYGAAFTMPFASRRWSGTAFLMPPIDGFVQYLPFLYGHSDGPPRTHGAVLTQPLQLFDGHVASFGDETSSATAYRGETLAFGAGAVLPRLAFEYVGVSQRRLIPHVVGQLDEVLEPGTPLQATLFDDTGTQLQQGTVTINVSDFQRKLTFVGDGVTHEIDGRPATTRWSMTFGGPSGDKTAPDLTSMLMRDPSGQRIVERVTSGTAVRMTVSADDNELWEAKTSLRVRRSPDGAWTTIPLTVTGQNVFGRGTIYEGEMRLLAKGDYDIELHAEDDAGNATTSVTSPAFVVIDNGGRTRAVRH